MTSRRGSRAGAAPLAPWEMRCLEGYIAVHLQRPISIEELAGLLHLGVWRFKRDFKRSFDCTPHQYLIRRRVQRAQALILETDESLREIAQRCGFSHEAHLSHLFQRFVGKRPARWRRTQRQPERADASQP